MEHLQVKRQDWREVARLMPLEAMAWLLGLVLLAAMEPQGEHLFSLCPLGWLLEGGCLGCGLGHGIAYLARGAWQASWQAHPLAGPTVLLLLWRCGRLLYFYKTHILPVTSK